ncbi:hypothetical protein AB0D67_29015 [Streptosporangium sp. NPDC048047]|uniref:hypothetical protein n=1 Tax=Streptosporangium sp. NPDC048047 TaxID=3155748 RepID=UPI0034365C5F
MPGAADHHQLARRTAGFLALLVAALITLATGCTTSPPSFTPVPPAAGASLPPPRTQPGPATPAQQRAAVAAARHFAHRLLTYTHRAPEQLAPSVRLRGLITHRYAAALAPRDRIDPTLATTLSEVSSVRITSARIAADAPGDSDTQYVLLTCTQKLTLDERTEHIELIWSLRLLRYGATWRVDEVSQAG